MLAELRVQLASTALTGPPWHALPRASQTWAHLRALTRACSLPSSPVRRSRAVCCAAGPPEVTFGGVPATAVEVAGPSWITGKLPSNAAGICSVDVTVSFGGTKLVLPEAFCYLPDLGEGVATAAPASAASASTPAADPVASPAPAA